MKYDHVKDGRREGLMALATATVILGFLFGFLYFFYQVGFKSKVFYIIFISVIVLIYAAVLVYSVGLIIKGGRWRVFIDDKVFISESPGDWVSYNSRADTAKMEEVLRSNAPNLKISHLEGT